MTFLARFEPQLRSIARIVFGFIFFQYGTQKFLGWFGGFGPNGGTAPIFQNGELNILGVAGIIETFGATLIMLGLFTRPVAFLLSGQMAYAYFRTHAPRGFAPIENGGIDAVLFCFFWLWLASAGAGPISLDKLMGRKS